MKKRFVSLLLTLAIIFGLFPSAALAAHQDVQQNQVHVIVENAVLTEENGAPWTGVLVDTWVEYTSESTMMTCLDSALKEGGHTAKGLAENWITEIDGLANQGGEQSGWMGTINDWFANQGFDAFTAKNGTLEPGDQLHFQYTLNWGADLGCLFGNADKHLSALKVSTGELEPEFSSQTLEYVLRVPCGTKQVLVTPTAVNKNYQVRSSVEQSEYKRTQPIPVEDGTQIVVACGDPNWESMEVNKEPAVSYTLTVKIPKITQPDMKAEWPSFRGNDYNNGVTPVRTPRSASDSKLNWASQQAKGWSESVSPAVIADGYMFLMVSSQLRKLNLSSGEVVATASLQGNPSWGTTAPTFGGGMIFCPLGDSKVQAVDAASMETLWVYDDLTNGQAQSPITYMDGKIYVGMGYGTGSCFFALDALDGTLLWREKSQTGYYWAGALAIGNIIVCGGENGHLVSRKANTGEIISDLTIDGTPNIRSTVCYADGHVYFTTKDARFCKADINITTGELKNLETLDCSSYGNESTVTPTVLDGIAYLGAGGFGSKHQSIIAVDVEKMEVVWAIEEPGNPQGSMLVSSGYADEGYVYIYVTYNNNPGGLNVIRAKADGSSAVQTELYSAKGHEQYCIASPIVDDEGNIYYKNDSGYVFSIGLSQAGVKRSKIEETYKLVGNTMESMAENDGISVGSEKGEWVALGLARSGRQVPDSYYENVLTYVDNKINTNDQLHKYKSTDNARVVLALTAMGKDPTNVNNHNLLRGLSDLRYVKQQGNNGPIWALIAFNSHEFDIPQTYKGGQQVSRENLVETILSAQNPDGGWNLNNGSKISEIDMTAMAVYALAPYYVENEKVRVAADQAVDYLASQVSSVGGFENAYNDEGPQTGEVNTESCAQTIVALASLGLDPNSDPRFVKNGMGIVDAMLKNHIGNGTFSHITGAPSNNMATEQAMYALCAYIRFLNGEKHLYEMVDVPFLMPFRDVPDSQWYHDYVGYVYEHSLMDGMTPVDFKPNVQMTRAQLVTVLYRMAGAPVVEKKTNYSDVVKGSFYEDAVAWADEAGITKGMTETTFCPNLKTNREQMATFFARYAKIMGADMTIKDDLKEFKDADDISHFATDAVQWAVASGLIGGMTPDSIQPQGSARRCQAATMLQRLDLLLAE